MRAVRVAWASQTGWRADTVAPSRRTVSVMAIKPVGCEPFDCHTRPAGRHYSIALTMSSTTFFASPKTIMVLSM